MWWVLIILIVVCFILVFACQQSNREHFQWEPLSVGKEANDCYGQTERDCLKYSNCGLCIGQDGKKVCRPGDKDGAFFDETCDKWQYTNFYDGNIFDETVTTTTRPYSYRIPELLYFPSPVTMASLQSFRQQ